MKHSKTNCNINYYFDLCGKNAFNLHIVHHAPSDAIKLNITELYRT